MKRYLKQFLIFVVFLLPPVVTAVGTYLIYDIITFPSHSLKTVGSIVDSEKAKNIVGNIGSYPVIEFKTEDGKNIKATLTDGNIYPSDLKGQMEILYDKENPKNIRDINTKGTLFISFMCFISGITTLIIEIFVLKSARRRSLGFDNVDECVDGITEPE